MPIYRLLQDRAFDPETLSAMTAAFEDALRELKLADRTDPAAELVAKKIIEFAQRGERDPIRLREHVVRSLSEQAQQQQRSSRASGTR